MTLVVPRAKALFFALADVVGTIYHDMILSSSVFENYPPQQIQHFQLLVFCHSFQGKQPQSSQLVVFQESHLSSRLVLPFLVGFYIAQYKSRKNRVKIRLVTCSVRWTD